MDVINNFFIMPVYLSFLGALKSLYPYPLNSYLSLILAWPMIGFAMTTLLYCSMAVFVRYLHIYQAHLIDGFGLTDEQMRWMARVVCHGISISCGVCFVAFKQNPRYEFI